MRMFPARLRSWFALCCLLILGACSLAPTQPLPPRQFDLGGAQLPAAPGGQPVQLQDCSAPAWLDTTAMNYRLNWRDPLQLQVFRDSRWVAPPCALLAQRLREVLTGGDSPPPRTLHLALDRFEQDFDSTSSSRVVIRLRATLMVPGTTPLARGRTFERELPVADPDAAHGVLALSQASDALLGELRAWALEP